MSTISSNNTSEKGRGNKNKLLFIFGLLIIISIIVFFIWFFTGEKTEYFNDNDKDGYGDPKVIKKAKIRPWGYVGISGDTDDNNPCVPDSLGVACKTFKISNTTVSAPSDPQPTEGGTGDSTAIVPPVKEDVIEETKVVAPIKGNNDSDGDSVDDKSDFCPTRKGTVNNKGCPEYQISLPNEAFIDENFTAKISGDPTLPNDKVNWQAGPEIIRTPFGKDLEGKVSVVGKFNIAADISNSDGFNISVAEKAIHIKIKPNVLADLFKPFYIYGSALSAKATNITVLKNKADVAKVDLKKHIKDGILSGAIVYDNTGGIVNDLETFINADIIGGSEKGGLKVSKVKYSSNTGKITEIHIQ